MLMDDGSSTRDLDSAAAEFSVRPAPGGALKFLIRVRVCQWARAGHRRAVTVTAGPRRRVSDSESVTVTGVAGRVTAGVALPCDDDSLAAWHWAAEAQ